MFHGEILQQAIESLGKAGITPEVIKSVLLIALVDIIRGKTWEQVVSDILAELGVTAPAPAVAPAS